MLTAPNGNLLTHPVFHPVAGPGVQIPVTVTCSPASGQTSFPAGTFTVSLTATQNTSLASCSDSDTKSLTVAVDPKPDVVVQPPGNDTVCGGSDTSKTLTFKVKTDQVSAGDITLNVTTNPAGLADVTCTAEPSGPVEPTGEPLTPAAAAGH